MSLTSTNFDRFAPSIKALPLRAAYAPRDLLTSTFRIHREGQLSVYYAPFDYVNIDARVALVGITPGWQQMEIGFREARHGLHEGLAPAEIMRKAKGKASFAGSMRSNLLTMLDGIDLPSALGITAARALFEDRSSLLHTTSALRYPVFVGDVNYTGHTPKLMRTQLLIGFVRTLLAEELEQAPDALVVPLGDATQLAIADLVDRRVIDARRCLMGFPHPSGSNGHRAKQFSARRDDLKAQVWEWFGA